MHLFHKWVCHELIESWYAGKDQAINCYISGKLLECKKCGARKAEYFWPNGDKCKDMQTPVATQKKVFAWLTKRPAAKNNIIKLQRVK